jgi:hypothetical protein
VTLGSGEKTPADGSFPSENFGSDGPYPPPL